MTKDILDAVVIGTGFAGLCSAIRLKENDFNFIVLEKESRVGGVWRDNTYPGAQCDVQSHLYSFSFEQYPYWTRTYGLQEEILNYMEFVSQKYGINPHIRFNTALQKAVWDSRENIWEFHTGEKIYYARYFFLGSGGLSQPLIPDFPNREEFQGEIFHSARWNHNTDLTNKNVTIIGSAASAIQIIPAIVDRVKKLNVFQRTANWILPKDDRPFTALEKLAFNLFPPGLNLSRESIYWMLEWKVMAFVYFPGLMNLAQKMAEKYIQESISDPKLRKMMTPNYTIGCKRILLSNEFYPAIQKPNAEVIDSGIQKFTREGIVAGNGKEYKSDIIITATGFHVAEGLVPFEVIGKSGISLNESWKDGPEAYLGTTIKNFPNLFMIVGPNTGLGHSSMVYMIESQVHYALEALKKMRSNNKTYLEVKPELNDAYNREIQEKLEESVWNKGGCKSWYKNASGKNVTLWPGFTFEFRNRTQNFQEEDYLLR